MAAVEAPKAWRRFLPLIGLGLFAWLASNLDYAVIARLISRIDSLSVVIAVLLFSANVLLKAWRWHRMLLAANLSPGRSRALAAFLSGTFYGTVSVGRVGEVMRAEVLTERGVKTTSAIGASMIDRLFDLATLLAIGWLGLATTGIVRPWVAVVVSVAVVGGGFVLLSAITQKSARVTELWQWTRRFMSGTASVEVVLLTALAWIFHFGSVVILARSLEITSPAFRLIVTTSWGALTNLIPITFQGLGTREVVFGFHLSSHGASYNQAIMLATSLFAIMVFSNLSLGAIGLIWRRRQSPPEDLMLRDHTEVDR